MAISARYAHTNLIADDWRRLARFYEDVFDCQPVPPERHFSGDWIEAVTNLPNVGFAGIHLRLPGHGPQGPTLEIFQYTENAALGPPATNRRGYGHLAFAVQDVAQAREAVLEAGGQDFGEVHSRVIEGAGHITFVYMTDPEGNIIELQQWRAQG